MIAHNLTSGTYKVVYVLNEEGGNVKEVIRLIKILKRN